MGNKIINVFAGTQIQPQAELEQKPVELVLVMYKEARRSIHRKIIESTSNPVRGRDLLSELQEEGPSTTL